MIKIFQIEHIPPPPNTHTHTTTETKKKYIHISLASISLLEPSFKIGRTGKYVNQHQPIIARIKSIHYA
jgi:hypothetical protein